MVKNLIKKLIPKTLGAFVFVSFAVIGMVLGIYYAVSFSEPISDNSGFNEPENTRSKGDWHAYGRGWEPNESGSGSVELSSSTCAAAYGWYWFEDGNGDGDTLDEEDGICVKATSSDPTSTPGYDAWNGVGDCATLDTSYIPDYTCAGNFPNGYVATYSGLGATCIQGSDSTYTQGDCALCETDCVDGKKDLPDRNSYTVNSDQYGGGEGPITTEVLKSWTGTRLPTYAEYYGFCGYKDGGDGHETGCSSDNTVGDYGQMIGRTDECIDRHGSSEWALNFVSIQDVYLIGGYACSLLNTTAPNTERRFRAIFRP